MRRLVGSVVLCAALSQSAVQHVAAQSWYDTSWGHRKSVTLNSSQVGSTGAPHTDFPVLVSIVDADLAADAQSDADDLLFTSDDGTTQLSHEIESYTSGTGALVAWVRVPSLPSASNTTLYMYYGNASASNQQDATGGTWSSDFEAVWHFDGDVLDATSNNADGTDNGTTSATGQIAGAREFSLGDYVLVSGLLGTPSSFTISAWVDLTSTGTAGSEVVSLGDYAAIRLDNGASGIDPFYFDGGSHPTTPTGVDVETSGWRHVVFVNDDGGDQQTVYLDGAVIGTTSTVASPSYSGLGTTDTYIGTYGFGPNPAYHFGGTMDEPRVANTTRSAGWVVTEYNNQNSPGTFHTIGSEQTVMFGTVFEDRDYGGGAGRNLATASGVGRASARVELYDNGGAFVEATTTDGSGDYAFGALPNSYVIRVVNSTVTSSRPGYLPGLLPVQTFRTDASAGVTDVTDYVGGQDPTIEDAGQGALGSVMNTTSGVFTAGITGTAQSFTNVTLTSSPLSDIDFGFNFNTIVNVNDSGQGSLRQFLVNSNTLTNVGLSIQGQTAGKDVTIFMISDGTAQPGLRSALSNLLTSGVARIVPSTALPPITNDDTTIDGSTQTSNVGNTNAVTLGSGGTVGVDSVSLGQVAGPEVEVRDTGALSAGFQVQADDATIRSVAILGWDGAAILCDDTFSGVLIEDNVLGTSATSFSDPGAALRNERGIQSDGADNGSVQNNLIGFQDGSAILLQGASSGWGVSGNEILDTGLDDAGADGVALNTTTSTTISANHIEGAASQGFVVTNASSTTFTNNTLTRNGVGTSTTVSQSAAITMRSTASGCTIDRNRIVANYGAGISVNDGATGIELTQNIFADNGTITARNLAAATGQVGIDLNSATDDQDFGTSPFVTLNDSGDSDAGGNNLTNYPVITDVLKAGSTISVRGFARPGVTLEFFTVDGDPSGFGEGEHFLLSAVEGSGNDRDSGSGTYGPGAVNGVLQGTDTTNRFLTSATAPSWLLFSDSVTGTATDGTNTSEFSGVAPISALAIAKRAFQEDGTALSSGASAARGSVVRFLLYVNNWGGAITDLSVEDTLDPGFEFISGTIRTDASISTCAADSCTSVEEAAIYSAVMSRPPGTDSLDGDTVSYTSGSLRVDAGDALVGNARLDVPAQRVWAMIFDVRVR